MPPIDRHQIAYAVVQFVGHKVSLGACPVAQEIRKLPSAEISANGSAKQSMADVDEAKRQRRLC